MNIRSGVEFSKAFTESKLISVPLPLTYGCMDFETQENRHTAGTDQEVQAHYLCNRFHC